MFKMSVENRGKVIMRGVILNVKEHDTKDGKTRTYGEIQTGPDEKLPFSAGHEEIQKALKQLEEKRAIIRGFTTFGKNEMGATTISVATWGAGEKPGVEPWTDDEQEPCCRFVGVGVVAELTKDDDGNITSAVLDASSTYMDRVRESHIPLTFTPEAAQLLVAQKIEAKDQISVFASLRFARDYDEKYEVDRTVRCEVLVEEVSLIAKGVGTSSTSGYLL